MPVGRTWGAAAVYRTLLPELSRELDEALGRVGPPARQPVPAWSFEHGAGSQTVGAADFAARAERVVSKQTDRLLEGPADPRRSVAQRADLTTVRFVDGDDRALDLTPEALDAMLTTGQLVSARPGPLPENLLRDVQTFVIELESRLQEESRHRTERLGGEDPLAIAPEHVPVVTFLLQQARLRERLPLRLLMVCTTCRLEKVVNPDLARMRERSRRTRLLTTSFGAVLGTHGVSPYIMLGRMAQLKKSEPDFVCPRCQGLDADECLVTFCPQCGERRDESVLGTCSRCRHDFRSLASRPPPWRQLESPPQEPTPQVDVNATRERPAYRPPAESCAPATTPASWHPDPFQRFELRYWDGARWTPHVSRNGVVAQDPHTLPPNR